MGEQVLRLDDLHEAAGIRNIYAGTLLDVMEPALSPPVDVAEVRALNIFMDLEPQIHGTPVWKMIRAARNNHHYWPEWVQADPPKGAQKHDIAALCSRFFRELPDPMPRSPIGHDASLDALRDLSTSYDELEYIVRSAAFDVVGRFDLEDGSRVVFAGQENGGPTIVRDTRRIWSTLRV